MSSRFSDRVFQKLRLIAAEEAPDTELCPASPAHMQRHTGLYIYVVYEGLDKLHLCCGRSALQCSRSIAREYASSPLCSRRLNKHSLKVPELGHPCFMETMPEANIGKLSVFLMMPSSCHLFTYDEHPLSYLGHVVILLLQV